MSPTEARASSLPLGPGRLILLASTLLLLSAEASAQYWTSKSYGTNSLLAGDKLGEPRGNSSGCRISADGTLRVFHSEADNYRGDSPGVVDVFMAPDFSSHAFLVSAAPGASPADGDSFDPDVSGDADTVVFTSRASNLVTGDTNGLADVFLYDVPTGVIRRISVPNGGGQANGSSGSAAVSGNGRFIAFRSSASNLVGADQNGVDDIFLWDRASATLRIVSLNDGGGQANGPSSNPAISESGQIIAFESLATNLIQGGDQNGLIDVYFHDTASNSTRRVSGADGGGDADGGSTLPAVSSNGVFVSFTSDASNLLPTGQDSNDAADVFLQNIVSNARQRVSVSNLGAQSNADSFRSSVSNNAEVAFASRATNLIGASDTNGVLDVFLRDTRSLTTVRLSVDSDGKEATGSSTFPDLSRNGCDCLFLSEARDLILGTPPEVGDSTDVFLHRHPTECTILCAFPEVADLQDPFTLRSTNGPPFGGIAIFITHVDDAAFHHLLLVSSYDNQGRFVLNTAVPNNPGLLNIVPSFVGYALPQGGGPIERTNRVFLGIQN